MTNRNHIGALTVGGGVIAFEDTGGDGPLVVCIPGLGDLRSEYRFLARDLTARGSRVVTVDLRGHGGSSASFADMTVAAGAGDIIALLGHLGGRAATLVGTSFGAAVAAHVAVEAPALVERVVVIGPFVRDAPPPFFVRLAMRAMLAGPWGRAAWMRYFDSLFPTRKPEDHAEHVRALRASLDEPGRFEALRALAFADRKETAPRLGDVKAPVLVVMGSKDPDFASPAEEARLVAEALHGRVLMIDDAGHYPHVEMPEIVAPAIGAFLAEAR